MDDLPRVELGIRLKALQHINSLTMKGLKNWINLKIFESFNYLFYIYLYKF